MAVTNKKQITGVPLQCLLLPKEYFPHTIAFQLIQISNITFIPVPFEVTYVSGNRITMAVKHSSTNPTVPIVVSCTNEYTGYCTTPEEYSMQRYEGCHTIYGPNTQPYLVLQYAQLAKALPHFQGDSNWIKNYPLKTKTFIKQYPLPAHPVRKEVKQPHYGVNPEEEDPYVFYWQDLPPNQLEFHKPLVSIEYSSDTTFTQFAIHSIPGDDTGYDVTVIFTGKITQEGMAVYEGR